MKQFLKTKVLPFLPIFVFLLALILVFDTYGANVTIWSLAIFFFIYVLFVGWRLYTGKDVLMGQIKIIETIIWGKPLDKDMWEKGELKKRKVKFVWKKKN